MSNIGVENVTSAQAGFGEQFKAAPRWQQRFIAVVLLCGVVGGGLAALDYAKGMRAGSDDAQLIKQELAPIADQLDRAQKLGDRAAVEALLDPILKVTSRYNDLPAAQLEAVERSSLRYCVLAARHLAGGVSDVYQTGSWPEKSQYEAALDACK